MGVPGLKVALPSTAADAKGLMATAIRDDNPVCFFHHYLLTLEHGEVPDGEYLVPFGEAGDPTLRQGRHDRRDRLVRRPRARARPSGSPAEGIEAEVIDPRTLAPLDTATILESVGRTGRLVLVDQSTRHGSVVGGDRRGGRRRGLRPAARADQAGHGARRDDPLQRADGGLHPARRGQDRHGGQAGRWARRRSPRRRERRGRRRDGGRRRSRCCARCAGSARSRSASACSSAPTRSTG